MENSNLQDILNTVIELHSAQYGMLSVYNTTSGCLETACSVGFPPDVLIELGRIKPMPEAGTCDRAFITKKSAIVEDTDRYPHYDFCRGLAQAINFRAVHSMPLLARSGETLGVLAIYFEKPHTPSPREIQLADMCSRHAADMIEATKAQQALQDSEQRFRTMADNSPVMIWVTDPYGFCTFLSKTWYDFTGQNPDSGLGFGWLQAIHHEDREKVEKIYCDSHDKQKKFQFEYRLLNNNQEYCWALDAIAPWFALNGEFLGYIGSVMDISERIRTEQTVRDINNKLEARVKERTQQLEIQSNRLLALADQVASTEQRERKRIAAILHDHLQQILVAATFQLAEASRCIKIKDRDLAITYVDKSRDYLNEAIRSARTLTTELRPPVLYEDGLVAALEWLAQKFKKDHDLEITLELEDVNIHISDNLKIMIFESIKELLFNTVKHAQIKKAKLIYKLLHNHMLYISVEDRGVGFDASHQKNIFTAYESGLGIFGMRERFKILNAELEISSLAPQGTKVEIRIPVETQTVDPKASEHLTKSQIKTSLQEAIDVDNQDKRIKILLVDDHKIVREGVANLLKMKQMFSVVAQAENGLEAIEKTADFLPDVIIMDVNMPKLNGIEATRLIKRNFPNIQIIGLSVLDEDVVADSMKKAGATAMLNKTGDPEELITTILNCMCDSEQEDLPFSAVSK